MSKEFSVAVSRMQRSLVDEWRFRYPSQNSAHFDCSSGLQIGGVGSPIQRALYRVPSPLHFSPLWWHLSGIPPVPLEMLELYLCAAFGIILAAFFSDLVVRDRTPLLLRSHSRKCPSCLPTTGSRAPSTTCLPSISPFSHAPSRSSNRGRPNISRT